MEEKNLKEFMTGKLKKRLEDVRNKTDEEYLLSCNIDGERTPEEYLTEVIQIGQGADKDTLMYKTFKKIEEIMGCSEEDAILYYFFTDISTKI